ncbi:MAG: hypothetical protein ACTSPB_03315 [Candidatus Thorarchaeota archaeon]|jgi:hypothetical protein|tara:strand:- start:27 stop:977 length:951 start_codon:yes stop_codon:yes gene_type:complete
MNPLTQQRALIALDLLLSRGISMTRATKLARTTPKTLKGYLAAKGIKWIIKNRRFEIVRTPEQKRFEMIDLMNEGKSATAAAKELETTVKTMSRQTYETFPGSGVEEYVISRTGGKWQTNFVKTENYSLVYYGGILGLGGTTIGRGEQMGPKATPAEADAEYMDIWWQVDFENWNSTLSPFEVAEFWKPQVMTILRQKLESLIISDADLANKFLGNSKVSAHAASTGRISASGDMDLTRLEQILQRYEAKMMSDVSTGVDDNLMFRPPIYLSKSELTEETSKGQFQVMFLNEDTAMQYPTKPEVIEVKHNLNDEQL